MQFTIDRSDVTSIAEAVAGIILPAIRELVANMITNVATASTAGAVKPDENDLLDQAQVAEIIGISESWLEKKRCVGGGIPFRKVGSKVRYKRKDVNDYIDSRTIRNTCEDPENSSSDD